MVLNLKNDRIRFRNIDMINAAMRTRVNNGMKKVSPLNFRNILSVIFVLDIVRDIAIYVIITRSTIVIFCIKSCSFMH